MNLASSRDWGWSVSPVSERLHEIGSEKWSWDSGRQNMSREEETENSFCLILLPFLGPLSLSL